MKTGLLILSLGVLAGVGIFAATQSQKRRTLFAANMKKDEESKKVDLTSDDSFPASDPPAWGSSTGNNYHH